jgi:hypothetical protein
VQNWLPIQTTGFSKETIPIEERAPVLHLEDGISTAKCRTGIAGSTATDKEICLKSVLILA